MAAIEDDEISHNRESQATARAFFIQPFTTLHRLLALCFRHAGTIIADGQR
jgi:hypothetical protein